MWTALLDWIYSRTGIRALRAHALDEPLPPGTGWLFTTGSVVALGSAVVDGQARLWVRDQGVGIRPEELDRVFERFARIDSGRGVEGSGLCLTIVRAIARAHGGEVEVASHPGEGATFTLVVPTGTSGDVRVESAGEADAGEVGRWPEY